MPGTTIQLCQSAHLNLSCEYRPANGPQCCCSRRCGHDTIAALVVHHIDVRGRSQLVLFRCDEGVRIPQLAKLQSAIALRRSESAIFQFHVAKVASISVNRSLHRDISVGIPHKICPGKIAATIGIELCFACSQAHGTSQEIDIQVRSKPRCRFLVIRIARREILIVCAILHSILCAVLAELEVTTEHSRGNLSKIGHQQLYEHRHKLRHLIPVTCAGCHSNAARHAGVEIVVFVVIHHHRTQRANLYECSSRIPLASRI